MQLGMLVRKWFGAFVGLFENTFGISPTEGALTQLFLVMSLKVEREGIRGWYFVPIAKEMVRDKLVTSELAAKL
jgi:hypothetical protein